jgi:hypothetical protein
MHVVLISSPPPPPHTHTPVLPVIVVVIFLGPTHDLYITSPTDTAHAV